MARYHLNLYNSVGFLPDEEGSDFRDLDYARRAVESVQSILRDEVSRGSLDMRDKIDMTDDAGRLIATVHFRDAVHLRLEGEAT